MTVLAAALTQADRTRSRDDPDLLLPFTTWPDAGPVAVSQFQLSGLHCAACAGLIEAALTPLPGVSQANVNASAARLALSWDPTQLNLADVLAAVERAGYAAVPDVAASARALRDAERRSLLWRLFVASFLMMQVMMLATPAYVAEAGELAPDLERLLQWGSWVLSLPVLVFSAAPFFTGAWRQLRLGHLGMDVPVSIGLAVTFVASSAALFAPDGPLGGQVYFDSLSMFVSLLLLARWFEMRARHQAVEQVESAQSAVPQAAERLLADGGSERVAPTRLRVGDRIRVTAGEGFAADGVVESGQSCADEALLSGESAPVPKGPGDEVVAGSINREAPLVVQVKRVGAATVAQGIVRLMQQAQGQRVEGLGVLNWVAARFTAAVLLLAAGAGLGWAWGEPSRALWVAVSVLVVTCPCALTLAAPSAWLAASGALARRGLLLTRLDLLERLNDIDTVVFDKTGTLSDGRLQLLGMDADGEVEASLLSRARGLAAQSRHPYSQAIARADLAAGWTAVKELPGCGLEALDAQGRLSRLGRPDWVASLSGRAVPADRQLAFGTADAALWLRLGETLRADAAEAVAQLQAQGLQVHLLSGDAEAAVRRVANTLNIPHWQAALSPEGKLAAVRGLQAAGGRVLMVGDGINDAPVLAAADLRVVMGQGALLARATADALLLSNRLVDLPLARRHARRTRKVLRQNLAWAAVYNFACVPLAVAGWLSPLAAGLGMALSSLLVVLNARRLSHT